MVVVVDDDDVIVAMVVPGACPKRSRTRCRRCPKPDDGKSPADGKGRRGTGG